MNYKYGIYQCSGTSCIFYKEDEDGNQSTFNLFINKEDDGKKSIHAIIDNDKINDKNWFSNKNIKIEEIFEAFNSWASEAPIVFELDAQKNIGNFLKLAFTDKKN